VKVKTKQNKIDIIKSHFNADHKQIAAACPQNVNIDKIVRSALHAMVKNPDLMVCTASSLFMASVEACMLGMELNTLRNESWLTPRKVNGVMTAVLVPGYMGMINVSYRETPVQNIFADLVYENDIFYVVSGLHRDIQHTYARKDRGEIEQTYAVYELPGGITNWVMLDMDYIERCKAAAQTTKIWDKWPEAMIKKTAIRQLYKWMPKQNVTERMDKLISLDTQAETGVTQIFDDLTAKGITPPPPETEVEKKILQETTQQAEESLVAK